MTPKVGDIWEFSVDTEPPRNKIKKYFLLIANNDIGSAKNAFYFDAINLSDGQRALVGIVSEYQWTKLA